MPKSTPMPMNSTAKATEIRFRAPTMSRPSAAVMTSPTAVARNTATMSRPDFSASQSRNTTASTVSTELSAKPSLRVPNSWSSSGIWPVSRTVTPVAGDTSSAASVARTTSVAAAPGSSAP